MPFAWVKTAQSPLDFVQNSGHSYALNLDTEGQAMTRIKFAYEFKQETVHLARVSNFSVRRSIS